jgi:hypothetical protein
MLSGLLLMVQAAVLPGEFFAPASPYSDGCAATGVDAGGRDVAESFVVTFGDAIFVGYDDLMVLQDEIELVDAQDIRRTPGLLGLQFLCARR